MSDHIYKMMQTHTKTTTAAEKELSTISKEHATVKEELQMKDLSMKVMLDQLTTLRAEHSKVVQELKRSQATIDSLKEVLNPNSRCHPA